MNAPVILIIGVFTFLCLASLLLMCERIEAGIAWVWSRVCSWRGGR